MLNGLNNGTEFDWGLMFVTPSPQNSSDDGDGHLVYKCRNCRYDRRVVRGFDSADLIALVYIDSHSIRLDDVVKVCCHCT